MNTYHLGIIGLSGAGKTVFLTSLLDHIFHHKQDKFHLGSTKGKPVQLGHAKELPDSIKAKDRFPYEKYRKFLAENRVWPEKSLAASRYSVSFERSDWWFSTDVHLFDFPGERFADSLMFGRDFGAWSDAIFNKTLVGSTALDDFFSWQEQLPASGAEELIRNYRNCLAKTLSEYRMLITPSTFLLDRQGSQPTNRQTMDEWARTRYAGLDETRQFTPLIQPLREKSPEIAEQFSKHYDAYRKEIVDPMFERLLQCDGCAVLVDIPNIFISGMGLLNDTQEILKWLASVVCPVNFLPLRKLLHLYNEIPFGKQRCCNLRRLAFVATKSDLICPDDAENMISLLKDLSSVVAGELQNLVEMDYFNCAAILSTETRGGKLFGKALYDQHGKDRPLQDADVELSPSPLGYEQWPPDQWKREQYFFPDVYPRWPGNVNMPPKQSDLDRVFQFLLDGKRSK